MSAGKIPWYPDLYQVFYQINNSSFVCIFFLFSRVLNNSINDQTCRRANGTYF